MKSQLNLKKALTTLLFVMIGVTVFAQTGRISGKVTDKKTGETLIGVTVKISGTSKGASTDLDGKYLLNGIADGKYTLTFQYIGYNGKEIADVVVSGSKNTVFDVILEETGGESLTEVMIQGSFRKESVNSLYASQKNSPSISSGVSADLIRRSPDRSTSDVLKRVSGASIQDNKFVIVRGLSDRYNSAMINNAILPSSEPDRKAFSFDIFPSNLIERIVINKTASPDLPGDFAGGVVQIFTKDVPDENFFEFSIGEGFNTIGKFGNFTTNINSKNKWLGASAGSRELPSAFPSSRQAYAPLGFEDKAVASRLLPNNYGETSSSIIPSQNHQATFGLRKDFEDGATLGSLVSLTYRSSQNLFDYQRSDYDNDSRTPVKYFDDAQNRLNVTWGGIANFSYKKGNNKFSFKNSYNRVLDDLYYTRRGYSNSSSVELDFKSGDVTQKSFYNTQLEGDHVINEKKWKLNWNLNYATIGSSRPDLRTIEYSRSLGTDGQFMMVDRNTRRFFSDLTDDNYGASVNLSVPFKINEENSTLKVGVLGLQKMRDFNARIFNYQTTPSASDALRGLPYDEIFAPQNISATGFVLNEFTNNADSYEGQSTLGAGYVMLDNPLSKKMRLVWGSRFEYYYQNIDGLDATSLPVDAKETYFDVLPSFNLTYALTEKANLRLSGSKTVSKPEFRELAPFAFYDFQTNTSIEGNPALQRGINYNVDARFEIYPSAGEAFTVSAFFKKFNDPIELYADAATSADLRRSKYGNANGATVYGFEVDFRKTLAFVGEQAWLKNITLFANGTYLNSEVEVGVLGGNNDRALQGQSPYLINAGLQYFSPGSGFTLSTLYNRIGQRISVVGNVNYDDWYENARDVFDVQLSKRLFKSKAELKLNVSDIFNQSIVTYQNLDSKKAYNKNVDRDIFVYKPGSSVSLSFSYKFGK